MLNSDSKFMFHLMFSSETKGVNVVLKKIKVIIARKLKLYYSFCHLNKFVFKNENKTKLNKT